MLARFVRNHVPLGKKAKKGDEEHQEEGTLVSPASDLLQISPMQIMQPITHYLPNDCGIWLRAHCDGFGLYRCPVHCKNMHALSQ
jgi:hypothetical protein